MQTDSSPVVLVTGSTGLIGTRIVRALADDFRVIGLDVKKPPEKIAGAEFMECDLTSDESVDQVLASIRSEHGDHIASVIHLAAYYDFSGEPSPLYDKLTVGGTKRLIQKLQAFDVDQFVFSSTLLMMAPAAETDALLTEDSPVDAEWAYPQSKVDAEKVLREERGDIPVVILRLAGVYDEGGHSLPVGQQISRIYQKELESFMFPGDQNRGQALVHLDDLVDCVARVIAKRGALDPWEVFLIAEPDVVSYGELQDRIGELLHDKEWPTIRIPKAVAKAGAWAKEQLPGAESFIKPWMVDLADQHYPVDIARARQRLGWEPRHRLRDTLDRIIAKLKDDPKAWFEENQLPVPEEVK